MNKSQKKDVNDVAFEILKQSKSFGVFPTPIQSIVDYSELRIETNHCLTSIPRNFFPKSKELLESALRKLRGALDTSEKIIYLDQTQHEVKKRFVQLHEVGHDVMPWQRKAFEVICDDDNTLHP